MVRLLSILMKDPLGYQDSPQYLALKEEEEEAARESMWGKEVLKGAPIRITSSCPLIKFVVSHLLKSCKVWKPISSCQPYCALDL